jgi:hypothetical protein
MPAKKNVLKIGRFNKKKLEVKGKVEQFFLAKVSGKVTAKMTKEIKLALNQVIEDALQSVSTDSDQKD